MIPLPKRDKPLTRKITIRVTEDEFRIIEEKAKNKGFKFIGGFVREVILKETGKLSKNIR